MLLGRIFQMNWLNQLLSLYKTHRPAIKKAIIAVIIVFNISCISICVSAFLFGTVYFYHMPTIQHSFPLYFHYNRTCIQQHKVIEKGLRWDRYVSTAYSRNCFPVAKIDISTPTNSKLLQEGQVYSTVLKLELPETPQNLNLGMFMVNMVVKGQSTVIPTPGEYRWTKRRPSPENIEQPIVKSSSKPMTMRYKSTILRFGYTALFWPLLLFDFMHESQILDEVLFENLVLDQKSYNWTAAIYVESPSIDVYSATLDVVAKFSGVQYLLYRWPIVSFFFGTLMFFLPTLFMNTIIFYFCIWRLFFEAQETIVQQCNPSLPESIVPSSSDSAASEPETVATALEAAAAAVVEEAPIITSAPENRESSSSRDDSNERRSSTPLKTPENRPAASVGGYSRHSSMSSIEMIGQPSHFLLADEEEPSSSFGTPDFTVAREAGRHNTDMADTNSQSSQGRCVRRWIVSRQPDDDS